MPPLVTEAERCTTLSSALPLPDCATVCPVLLSPRRRVALPGNVPQFHERIQLVHAFANSAYLQAYSIELPEECVEDVEKVFKIYRDPSRTD